MKKYGPLSLFIGGQWLTGGGREEIEVINPSTEEVLGKLPRANKADLDAVVVAANEGFQVWKKVSSYDRAKILKSTANLLRERTEEIAHILTLEQGKPIMESRMEVRNLGDILDWDAEEGRRSYGRVIPSRVPEQRQIVLKEPIGPVATFTPWNFPALIPIRKIAAVLAAGCSCIIKPAEETPATALAIAKAFDDAGLPKGVLNVIFGVPSEISTHLIAAPEIRGVSFTGSTAVGKHLSELAARGIKRTVMELGGHAPVVVFDDIEVDEVAQSSALRKFRNGGQGCVNPTRFYIHDSIFDRFVTKFTATAKTITPGDGFASDSKMGPLAHGRRIDAMKQTIDDAVKHGGKVALGGKRIDRKGFFWQPTVLVDVPVTALIMNEEPFGPAVVLNRWSKYEDVIAEANRTPYGLAAYAFTKSGVRAREVQDDLQAGMIGINTYALGAPDGDRRPGDTVRRGKRKRLWLRRRDRGTRSVSLCEVRKPVLKGNAMSEVFTLDETVQPTKLSEVVPNLEFALQSRVIVEPVITSLGNLGGMGIRKMLNILGGDFEGPKLKGEVLLGGADWPLIRPDGVGLVDARYTYRTDDGVLINVRNTGYRHAPDETIKALDKKDSVVDPEQYYIRTYTVFEAPQGKYDWMSRHVFIGIAERHPKVLFLRYYMLH